MPKPIVITADSTVDLSAELIERFQIRIIPLTIVLGEETFLDGQGFTPLEMYARYRTDGTLPHTAAPGEQDFYDFFSSFTKKGFEVVHIDISSELSNSFNAARLAARRLPGVYPVDSRMLSTGGGLLAIEAAECRDKGMSAAEIAAHIGSLTDKVSTSFVLDTLTFMWKGGRCSGVAALGANLLKLKPALRMREGKLEVFKKYRGNIDHVYKQYISEMLEGRKIRPGHIFITESGEVEHAVIHELSELVKTLSGCREVHHTLAGCTVSSHCGPKTLGVLFIEE
ncbi:MAG: DegV family protein [Lachnospiraceae bacterium]|nr:DegV family protein [Lachnospiraceae bacterium]